MEIGRTRIGRYFRTGWANHRRHTRMVLAALPFILLAAGVGLCVFSAVRLEQIKESQKSQIAAELWSGDSGKSYRQLTCFARGQQQADGTPDLYLSTNVSLNISDIESIRTNLNTIVKASSGEKDKSQNSGKTDVKIDDKKLWIDAYSSEAACTIVREATTVKPQASVEVQVTGAAGDYYLFHPLTLLSGAFLSEDTIDSKKIVLDKELAFKLFGFYDVVGSDVMINQRHYTIVGVVQHPDTKIDVSTSGDLLHAYILFDELQYLSGAAVDPGGVQTSVNTSADGSKTAASSSLMDTYALPGAKTDSSTLAISCYELVLPNKIKGIALQNLGNAMESAGKVEKNFLIVDNTSRFSLLRLYDTVFPIGENALERQQYDLPFWELAAQKAESVSVFWWVIGLSGFTLILTSGLSVYAGVHKRKEYGV